MSNNRIKTIQLGDGRVLQLQEQRALEWFEELYAGADDEGRGVPWANMKTHPLFAAWLDQNRLDGRGKSALVVGCGMGDDALELAARGFEVTAFDVAASAIEHCKARFPGSNIRFVQADLFAPPAEWSRRHDFVLEIYTVQAVPPVYEDLGIRNIADFVAPGGSALVIAEVGAGERSFDEGPPWLLTPGHVEAYAARGLVVAGQQLGTTDANGSTSYTTLFTRPVSRPFPA